MKSWMREEIDILFQQIYQQNLHTITLAGASKNSGNSQLSIWLAQRCANCDERVLLVDLDNNPDNKLHLPQPWFMDGRGQNDAMIKLKNNVNFLPNSDQIITLNALRQPDILKKTVIEWRKEYQYILFDIGTVSSNQWQQHSTIGITSVSDGCILTFAGAKTSEHELLSSLGKLKYGDSNLIGIVMNNYHNPSLADSLSDRLKFRYTWLPKKLREKGIRWLNRNFILKGHYH